MDDIITLDHGSGGRKTSQLIEELILPRLSNEELDKLSDGAILDGSGRIVFSTDSFVVKPYFFPGGDIGKLAVCGTVNDICMCGGVPKYLSLGLIIEEGLPLAHLEKMISSISETAKECGVTVSTGDTKVVERGCGDGIYINTSGIGFLKYPGLSVKNIREGDAVIVTGNIGEHGAAVMLARDGLLSSDSLVSDCAPLIELASTACGFGDAVRVMRDPTRGGIATTLNEFVNGSPFSIELNEDAIPVSPSVRNACDILGIDPLYCANEGRIVLIAAENAAASLVDALRAREDGLGSAVIGHVTSRFPGKVTVNTPFGGTRIVQKLSGAQLPRIC